MDGFDNLSELQNPEKSFCFFEKTILNLKNIYMKISKKIQTIQIVHGTEAFLGDMKHSQLPWAVAIRNQKHPAAWWI